MLGNQIPQTRFDLGVAVRAEQDALSGFGPEMLDLPCQAAAPQPETLLRRVHVMEVQSRQTPVVAAEPTAPSGLLDEDLLRLAPPSGHSVCGATTASHGSRAVDLVLGRTMCRALQRDALAIDTPCGPGARCRDEAVAG